MRILITGGTGFIGTEVYKNLVKEGRDIIIISRKEKFVRTGVRVESSTENISSKERIDTIINLAGARIDKRWNKSYKKELVESRLKMTENVVKLIRRLEKKPRLLISASAIGYYGTRNDDYMDESSSCKEDFVHRLCNSWEREAGKARSIGVRTCIARLGIVLGKDGGMLGNILPIFKLGLGGKIGSGKQWFSWIHIDDVIEVFKFFMRNEKQEGIFNLTSPKPVRNSELTSTLGTCLNKKTLLNVPRFVVSLVFGEMGENLLLKGAAVYPKNLIKSNYKFKYTNLCRALRCIIEK